MLWPAGHSKELYAKAFFFLQGLSTKKESPMTPVRKRCGAGAPAREHGFIGSVDVSVATYRGRVQFCDNDCATSFLAVSRTAGGNAHDLRVFRSR